MKKKLISILVLVLLLSSIFVSAQQENTAECGFFCKISQLLWGSSEARAGKGWFERGATGEAAGAETEKVSITSSTKPAGQGKITFVTANGDYFRVFKDSDKNEFYVAKNENNVMVVYERKGTATLQRVGYIPPSEYDKILKSVEVSVSLQKGEPPGGWPAEFIEKVSLSPGSEGGVWGTVTAEGQLPKPKEIVVGIEEEKGEEAEQPKPKTTGKSTPATSPKVEPARPNNVPEGGEYFAGQEVWADVSGKVYDSKGEVITGVKYEKGTSGKPGSFVKEVGYEWEFPEDEYSLKVKKAAEGVGVKEKPAAGIAPTLTTTPIPTAESKKTKAEKLAGEGDILFGGGKYEEAMKKYDEALKSSPGNTEYDLKKQIAQEALIPTKIVKPEIPASSSEANKYYRSAIDTTKTKAERKQAEENLKTLKDDSEAQAYLNVISLSVKDIEKKKEALTSLKTSCKEGEGFSCSYAGKIYSSGEIGYVDYKEAGKLFELGCEKNDPASCFNFGVISEVTTEDFYRAKGSYEKAKALKSSIPGIEAALSGLNAKITAGGKKEEVEKKEAAEKALGPKMFEEYQESINWAGSTTSTDPTPLGTLVLTEPSKDNKITFFTDKNTGITQMKFEWKDTENKEDKKLSRTLWSFEGNPLVQRSVEQSEKGMMTIGGQEVYVGTYGQIDNDQVFSALKSNGLNYYTKEGETTPAGKIVFANKIITLDNYQEGKQTVNNLETNRKYDLTGDYIENKFYPLEGEVNVDGTVYKLNYIYESEGKDKKLQRVEFYDSRGDYKGSGFDEDNDGTPEVSYMQEGNSIWVVKSGAGTKYVRDENGQWKDNGGNSPDKAVLKKLTETYQRSTLEIAQTTLSSIYALSQSIKSYPALSQLLGLQKPWKDWLGDADKTFAPLLGSNWFPSTICESHYDLEPAGTAMIKTVSGTYQAVASIQAERTEKKSPILCARNPDEEAEEQWICDGKQVCVEDSFCYKDQDENLQPDEEKPLQGYFYKITWGVSAPRDEALTPFIDENGVAVSFNIWLYPEDGSSEIPIYHLGGDTSGPIKLKNGESDRDVILHYSSKKYSKACLVWNQAPETIKMKTGITSGTEPLPAVCFNVITSELGQVNWQKSGQPGSSGSVKVSTGQVGRNSNW